VSNLTQPSPLERALIEIENNNINDPSPLGRSGGVYDQELFKNRVAQYP